MNQLNPQNKNIKRNINGSQACLNVNHLNKKIQSICLNPSCKQIERRACRLCIKDGDHLFCQSQNKFLSMEKSLAQLQDRINQNNNFIDKIKVNIFQLEEYLKQSRTIYEDLIQSNKRVLLQFEEIVDITHQIYKTVQKGQFSNDQIYQMMILNNKQIEKIYRNTSQQLYDNIKTSFQQIKILKINTDEENKDLERQLRQISFFLSGSDQIFQDAFNNNLKLKKKLNHLKPIQYAVRSYNDIYVATIDSASFVIVWDLENYSQISNFSCNSQFTSLIFGQYNTKLYLGSKDGLLFQLSEIQQQQRIDQYNICKSQILQIEQDLNNVDLIYIAASDQKLRIFSQLGKRIIKQIEVQYKGFYNFIKSQKNKCIICPKENKLSYLEDKDLQCLFQNQEILDSKYQIQLRLQHMKDETQFLFHQGNQNQFKIYKINNEMKFFSLVNEFNCNQQILGFSWVVFDKIIIIEHQDSFFLKSNQDQQALDHKTIIIKDKPQRKLFIQQPFLCDQLIYIEGQDLFIIE